MLQREERRIMFNLNDNIEFASGKKLDIGNQKDKTCQPKEIMFHTNL